MTRQEGSVELTRRAWLAGLSAARVIWSGNLEADLILHGANIITIDPANPRAQAIAIAGDRILAIRSDKDVLNLATVRTRKVDVTGRTVLPGFIDAHTHVAYSGIRHLKQVDCDLRSIADIQKAIRARGQNAARALGNRL
jgi:predicted amidohydrolase YtcJ